MKKLDQMRLSCIECDIQTKIHDMRRTQDGRYLCRQCYKMDKREQYLISVIDKRYNDLAYTPSIDAQPKRKSE